MSKDDIKIFNFFLFCIVTLGLASAVSNIHISPHLALDITHSTKTISTPTPAPSPVPTPYTPQFILLSFDGSKSVEMWKETRAFEDEMNTRPEMASHPLHFTYFINAAYFLTPDKKDLYQAPREERGKSNIGFSEDLGQLRERIAEVNKAVLSGDEIASHTAGHFWGQTWTKEEWEKEFSSFNDLLFSTDKNYPDANLPKLNLTQDDIVGFRAPALSISPNLYDALYDNHFQYDSSEVGNGKSWPTKDIRGIWHIPLGVTKLNQGQTPVIAMDYSIRAYELKRESIDLGSEMSESSNMVKGSPEWNKVYQDVLTSYMQYFNRNYNSNRAPVLIGHHFATWDDELYWEVMKEFAQHTCGLPEVKCGTFRELVQYLNTYGVPKK